MNSPATHPRRLPPVFELAGPETLARLRGTPMKQNIRSITVVDSGLPADEARSLERQLNRWYFACGCEQGSLAVLLTLLTSVAAGLRAGFDGALAWWCIVGYVMAAALVGKVLGLLYAKTRLRGLYRRLESDYAQRRNAVSTAPIFSVPGSTISVVAQHGCEQNMAVKAP